MAQERWTCVICLEEQPPAVLCRDCGCPPLPPPPPGGSSALLPLVSALLCSPPDPAAGLAFLSAHGLGSEAALECAVNGAGLPRLQADGAPPVRAPACAPPRAPPLRFGVAPPPRVGLCYDARMLGHEGGGGPERPDRLRAAAGVLAGLGLLQACVRIAVPEPPRGAPLLGGRAVARACDALHAAELAGWERDAAGAVEGAAPVGPQDARFSRGTPLAARLALAAVGAGVRAAARGVVDRALCLVRPPGHHASAARSGGFCVLNSVGAAVKDALEEERLARVLIVDLDVHHGDGTEALFAADPRVLTFSLHRWDGGAFYPGSGAAGCTGAPGSAGEGFAANVAVDGSWVGDAEVGAVVDRVLAPLARAFCPQLVVVSLGADSGRGDPIGDWDVSPAGYAAVVHALTALGVPLVVALEGGYNLATLSASLAAVARVLLGEAPLPLAAGEVGVPVLPERAVLEGGDGGVFYGSPASDAAPEMVERAAADREHARALLAGGRAWRAAWASGKAALPPHPGRAMGPRPAALQAIAATQAALTATGRWPGLF